MLRLPTVVFLDDKRTIDCADGIFKIEVIHADNDDRAVGLLLGKADGEGAD